MQHTIEESHEERLTAERQVQQARGSGELNEFDRASCLLLQDYQNDIDFKG